MWLPNWIMCLRDSKGYQTIHAAGSITFIIVTSGFYMDWFLIEKRTANFDIRPFWRERSQNKWRGTPVTFGVHDFEVIKINSGVPSATGSREVEDPLLLKCC